MDSATQSHIQAIHNSQTQTVLVTAGAGTEALSNLLHVAGASRTLLEAIVPYSEASLIEFLGQRPTQYVAEETSCLMAGRAYTRARWLLPTASPVVGMACTATIVTDRPKRGQHRAYITTWQPEKVVTCHLQLEKGARDRAGEESIVSKLMLNMLLDAYHIKDKRPLMLREEDHFHETQYDFAEQVRALLAGEISYFNIEDNGRLHTNQLPKLLLPGSFNPLHQGHLAMAEAASALVGIPSAFELTATNADKPPLPPQTILNRLAQFAGRYAIFASTAPTFVEKSRIFPGTTFIVGFDTAERILQSRFYKNSPALLLDALSEIKERGCSFLVAGRVHENGRFQQQNELPIPQGFKTLFQPLPFRQDISSTELRNTNQKGSR